MRKGPASAAPGGLASSTAAARRRRRPSPANGWTTCSGSLPQRRLPSRTAAPPSGPDMDPAALAGDRKTSRFHVEQNGTLSPSLLKSRAGKRPRFQDPHPPPAAPQTQRLPRRTTPRSANRHLNQILYPARDRRPALMSKMQLGANKQNKTEFKSQRYKRRRANSSPPTSKPFSIRSSSQSWSFA